MESKVPESLAQVDFVNHLGKGMRADLDKLHPLPKMIDKINLCERFGYLDSVGRVARAGFRGFFSGGSKPKSTFESLMDLAIMAAVDWDQVLRMGNSWYDRLADGFRKPTRAERQTALSQDRRRPSQAGGGDQGREIAGAIDANRRPAIRDFCADWPVFCGHVPAGDLAGSNGEDLRDDAVRPDQACFRPGRVSRRPWHLPGKAGGPMPKYVAEVPKDIFSASELHYRQEGGGYLLYSVGINGKDDGGKGYDDRKGGENWDDLAVRVPAATARKQ